MNKPLQVLALIAAMGLSSAANAALFSRLGGQAVYDDDLNLNCGYGFSRTCQAEA